MGFHVKLKQLQSVSLKNVYIVENKVDPKQKGKTIKADKLLFRRLLVAKYAGREIDLKKLLCHELSPVPQTQLKMYDPQTRLHLETF